MLVPSVKPSDFTIHTAIALLGDGDPWAKQLPPPRALPEQLIAEIATALEARATRPLYLFCPAYRESFYQQHGYVLVTRRDVPRCLGFKGKFAIFMQRLGVQIRIMRKD